VAKPAASAAASGSTPSSRIASTLTTTPVADPPGATWLTRNEAMVTSNTVRKGGHTPIAPSTRR
jgi:hypothetical protein